MTDLVDALLGIFTCPAKKDALQSANKVLRDHTVHLENELIGAKYQVQECKKNYFEKGEELQDNIIEIQMLKEQLEDAGETPKNPKEIYYHNKYPLLEYGYHIARPLPTKDATSMRMDVRDFLFFENNVFIKRIVEGHYKFGNLGYQKFNEGTDDEKALKCCIWVQDHFKYVSDIKQTGVSEYWFYPNESLETKKGDCEDGAILMKNLMLACGIPDWQARVTFADVSYMGGTAGHMFVTYYSIEQDKWVILDWCYYPNKLSIADRKHYKDEGPYKKVHLSFTKEFVWGKDEGGD